TRNQELAAALESSTLTNSQLNTKLDQLTQQTRGLTDQLQKERKEFEDKYSKEQGAMREQLQVHIQTIGILVSEKSELQTALQYTQQAARQKSGKCAVPIMPTFMYRRRSQQNVPPVSVYVAEAEELNNRLQSSKQRVSELERTLSSVSTQQKQFEKHNKELEKERDNLRLELFRLNNVSEETKQQNSELSEQLKLSNEEKGALKFECSSQSDPTSASQQAQSLFEEKQQLEMHNHQLLESIAHLQKERDCYAEQIQEEGRVWKDKTEQLLTQVALVAEERDQNISRVQELEAAITELKSAAAEPRSSEPTERELALQEALNTLQQEKDTVTAQFQTQLRDNEQLSRLCAEQETHLGELERRVKNQVQEEEDRRRMLEDVQSDKATISRALTQNRTLKDQLAELQNGFVKVTNENMELTNAIQSELHVKKELARRMGELQEELHNIKEQLEVKSQETQGLLAQRDQLVAHLQQYSAGYQSLVSEREQLHQQYLQQAQLMDRLHHDESQGRVQLEISHTQLKQAQVCISGTLPFSRKFSVFVYVSWVKCIPVCLLLQEQLELLVRDNEQLKSEVRELLNSSALASSSLDHADGGESSPQESSKSSSIIIPEDFESQKEMVRLLFLNVLEDVQAKHFTIGLKLMFQICFNAIPVEINHFMQTIRLTSSLPTTGGVYTRSFGSEAGVPVEVHQALQVAMEKLQYRFTSLMQEKADLKERVEELEHRCIQLSGETDTIGEYIALYQSQRAIMKQKHHEKEQYINMLAQDKEEMKMKLAELQDLVMRLVAERNDWYSRYTGAVTGANPDLLPVGQEHTGSEYPAQCQTEPNAVGGAEAMEIIPLSEPTTDTEPPQPFSSGSTHPDTKSLGPKEDGTAQQIMQLLQEIQNPQGTARSPSFLGENPCIPFFYRPDEQEEVKILVV
ncbi:unnamed protein product, partial [Tetraodon nigroviridis]